MKTAVEKLKVLSTIARVLNEKKIVWAVGASLLLYIKGKTDDFHDIDLMVSESDVELLKEQLLSLGVLVPTMPNKQYKTRHFLEFVIEEVEVDVMAGLVIVKDGQEFDCSLSAQQIEEYVQVHGQQIPLQSLNTWRRYYQLMGRNAKVEMIDC